MRDVRHDEEERPATRARRRMERLSLVAETTRDTVIVTDADQRIEWVNQGFETLTGYSEADVVGRRPGVVLQGPDTCPAVRAALRDAIAAGRPHRCELINYRRSGEAYWIDIEISAIKDADGRVERFIAVERDVTHFKAAQAKRDQFARIVTHCPQAVYVIDARSFRFLHVNRAAIEMIGFDESALTRMSPLDIDPEVGLESLQAICAPLIAGEASSIRFTTRHRRKCGAEFPCEIQVFRHQEAAGLRFVAFATDVTANVEMRRRLDESETRFKLAVEGAADGVFDYDPSSGAVFYSHRVRELLDLGDAPFPPTLSAWLDRIAEQDRGRIRTELAAHLESGAPFDSVYRIRDGRGADRWWRSRGQAVWDATGAARRMVGTHSDITALKDAQQTLERRNAELDAAKRDAVRSAMRDFLTDLPNRRSLNDRVDAAARSGAPLAFMHVDLDRFKEVNDLYGHAVGDAALRRIGRRLRAACAEDDFLARIGGDEFAILRFTDDEACTLAWATKLAARLGAPMTLDERRLTVGASVGVAFNRISGRDPERLMADAGLALNRAKLGGKARAVAYTEALHDELLARRAIEADLCWGVETRAFTPYFQPQFKATDLTLIGAEALARRPRPDGTIDAPGRFLDLAQDLGLVADVDAQILEKACDVVERWRAAGFELPRLSVNASGPRLSDPGFVRFLRERPSARRGLAVELLESSFLDEVEGAVAWTLDQLRELGVGIEIDDFGTGYTSIVGVLNLRPDRLKIDRKLVRDIDIDATRRALVRSIIDMAHALGVSVIAEGVETAEQLETLRAMRCDALQGFGLGPPVDAETFLELYGRSGRAPSFPLHRAGGDDAAPDVVNASANGRAAAR